MARFSELTGEKVPPLFMFGFERSGTTLLSMMVGAHPEIAVPLTVTGLWYRYASRLREYDNLETRSGLERIVDDLLAEERIQLWDVDLTREEVLRELAPGSLGAIVERFHGLYACKKGKPSWGNLDIATLDEMDVAHRWFPGARFLHIVRDGRDVALSHETMPYGAANTLDAAETWSHRLTVNLKMGAILGPEQYKVVRYEDLVSDSEVTLQSLCSFFGVPYSPAMLDYPKMVDEKVPRDRRWLWPALDKPPDRSKIFGWRKRMGSAKRIVFEGAAGSMLRELGYETYPRVPKSVSAYAYELWCFLGRGGRFRRLASKLGLGRLSKLERRWRKVGGKSYEDAQKETFGTLVREGVYAPDFGHAPPMRAFFERSMKEACSLLEGRTSIRVLDSGCGPGAWLDVTCEIEKPFQRTDYFGFDLTPEMVAIAQRRLSGRVPESHLQQGDILEDISFRFNGDEPRFDLIYAFDVVQQLPRKRQLDAIRSMLRHVAQGGVVVVFDHDRWSVYGMRMGIRKFLTKYLHVGLVPRYYCNAHYPALSRLAQRLGASGYRTKIELAPDGRKRALFVQGGG